MTSARLSPLHDAFSHGTEFPRAAWGEFHKMRVPLHLDEPAKEREMSEVLAIADVSFLPRIVVKGPQAVTFLEGHGLPLPTNILSVIPLEAGGLIARTGGSEFFLEDGVSGDVVARIESALLAGQPGVYPVLRQDAAIILSGSRAGELFRHVCSYDFLTQPSDDLVFTQVAGVSCSILRTRLNTLPAFRLWMDGTFGLYLWHTLLEIARELGGNAVGTAVFYQATQGDAFAAVASGACPGLT